MSRSRHRRARDLWLLRALAGTACAGLAVSAGLLGALAEDPRLLRTAVVLALTGLVVLALLVAAGAARGSRQLAEATAELAEATRRLGALEPALPGLAPSPPPNGSDPGGTRPGAAGDRESRVIRLPEV